MPVQRGSVWGETPAQNTAFFVQIPKADAESLGGISECLSRVTRSGRRVADFGIGTADCKSHYWLEIHSFGTGSGALLQHLEGVGIPKHAIAECREIPFGTGPATAQQRSLFA